MLAGRHTLHDKGADMTINGQASVEPHLVQACEAEHAHLVQDEAPVPVAIDLCQVPVQVLAHLLQVHNTAESQSPPLAHMCMQNRFPVLWLRCITSP